MFLLIPKETEVALYKSFSESTNIPSWFYITIYEFIKRSLPSKIDILTVLGIITPEGSINGIYEKPFTITEDIFSASINWGDDTSEEKVAVVQATGEVIGTHTYSNAGSFTIEITINSDSGATITRGIFVYVNPPVQNSY